jgi:hypothetical protein
MSRFELAMRRAVGLVSRCRLQNDARPYLRVDCVFAEAEQRYMIDADWHVRDCLAGFEKYAEKKSSLLFGIDLGLIVDKWKMSTMHTLQETRGETLAFSDAQHIHHLVDV